MLRQINQEAQRIRAEHQNANLSVIYTGDFNSRPESQVYQLIKTQGEPTAEIFENDLAIEALGNAELMKVLAEIRQKEMPIY